MMDVRMQLLGGFLLESDRVPVPLPRGAQHLLACLALHGRASRPHLGAILWPDLTERRSLACLRTQLWRIKQAPPELLTTHGEDLALSDRVRVDVEDVSVLASRYHAVPHSDPSETDIARIIAGGPALRGGPLLPGWHEEWVLEERGRLEQLRLHALESCAAWLLRAGETELALELALEAVHSEPLRESATASLISVHVAEGNLWDAVREYETFHRSVLDELGVAPSERLTGLLPEQWRSLHGPDVPSPRGKAGAGERSPSPRGSLLPTQGSSGYSDLRHRPSGRAARPP